MVKDLWLKGVESGGSVSIAEILRFAQDDDLDIAVYSSACRALQPRCSMERLSVQASISISRE